MSSASAHLTNEEFTDLLVEGVTSPASAAHLAQCAQCQAEQQIFLSTVDDFTTTSFAWMETKTTQPFPIPPQPRRQRSVWAPAGLAFATALLVMIAIPTWNRSHTVPAPAEPALAAVEAPDDSASDIARDNQLMQSVSIALNSEDDVPLSAYHLPVTPAARSDAHIELRKR